MIKIRPPKSLTEIVADRLRDDIVNGDLAMGEGLSEAALAASLGISKTPVREALVRLKNEGLVNIVPRSGTFVFSITGKDLADICDLRTTLETNALTLAFERNGSSLRQALLDIVAQMTAARARGDVRAYLRLDTEFHEQFFRFCDNAYMTDAYHTISAKMAALRTHLGTDPQHMQKSYDEHTAIAQAVEAQRHDTALDILERHIARKEGSYWQHLEERAPLGTRASA